MQRVKLTDLGFETEDVLVRPAAGAEGEPGYRPAQYMTVRGFSADDVMNLVKIHGPALNLIFEQGLAAGVDFNSTAALTRMAYEHAPELLADIIVMATDSTGDDYFPAFEIAKKLPISTQFSAIEKIARLTFVGEDAVGEFIGTVVKMLGALDGLRRSAQPSADGSGASGKQSRSLRARATQKRTAGP